MIMQIFEKSPFVDEIDACSRVRLFGSNAMSSSEIIKYGDVTKISRDGITYENGRFALIPSFDGGHLEVELFPDGSKGIEPTSGPCPIAEVLASINGTDVERNSLYLSKKLHLNQRDPDSADGYWKRCFCDPGQWTSLSSTLLEFYDADGVFDCQEEMLVKNGYPTVMETKFFKAIDSPRTLWLHFKPNRSRLWQARLPVWLQENLFITSELGTVLANQYETIWWFQNCGELDKMDFSLLRSYRPTFLLMEFLGDSSKTCNSYAEALAFKAAALRQNIPVSILALQAKYGYSLSDIRGTEYIEPNQTELSDDKFLQKCDDMRLSIDPILLGNPYEIKIRGNEEHPQVLLPSFFNKGRLTLLQESACNPSIRMALISLLCGMKSLADHPSTIVKTLMFGQRGSVYRLKKQMQAIDVCALKIYEDTILLGSGQDTIDEMKALLDENRPELILFELSGYTATQEKSLLAAMDVCLDRGISVGVFCEDGNASRALSEMVDRNLIIGMTSPNSYIIKEKTEGGSSMIRKFNFEGETVLIEESSEKDLGEAMKG